MRLFEHVIERLANGQQPDTAMIAQTGYLMRTTAVYGNGKFGLADRERTCQRAELATPYQAELLTVYLIRCFTHDLVEHIAYHRNPEKYVPLDREIRRYLGIGNATGLGMAPFLYHHPILIHCWVNAVETALAAVRDTPCINQQQSEFNHLLMQAQRMSTQWNVQDERQMQRIVQLREDLIKIQQKLTRTHWFEGTQPWNMLYCWVEDTLSIEAQELIAALLIEMHPEKTDHLAVSMGTTDIPHIQADMTLEALCKLIENHYAWALEIDFNNPQADHFFWYASEEKLEPRVGERYQEPGADREHKLTAARDVAALYKTIQSLEATQSIAEFLLNHPEHRHIVRRVQTSTNYHYAEIQENLIGSSLLPIDMLRFKLAFFGATKFDPKSDKWTRICLYQGAPLPDEIGKENSDRWILLPYAPTHRETA